MKDRQKRILRFLLTNKGIVRIEDIAATFDIGKRTVSRDLDILESWLSLRGALLERKRNQGIQVVPYGKSAEGLLDVLNTPDSYIETLPQETRQSLCLLYLIYNNREIKISEISQTFFASDTTIWSDLNVLDQRISASGFSILRMKGIGISLHGDEQRIRTYFIQILTQLFSAHTIIPYLYRNDHAGRNTLELNQFRILMKRIHFPEASERIMQLITRAESMLGYHFTMSGEAVLYFYLLITLHRMKSGSVITSPIRIPALREYERTAEYLLDELLSRNFSGAMPPEEVRMLSVLLQVLEIGDMSDSLLQVTRLPIDPEVADMLSELISEMSIQDRRYYYIDDAVLKMLNITMSALINRMRLGVPLWHGDWGVSRSRDWNSEQKKLLVRRLLSERFSITISDADVESILMQLFALALGRSEPVVHTVRCVICCFEGIGLAVYLKTLIERDFPELEIIEATAVYKIEEPYIQANRIDLIITTYPVPDSPVPAIQISLPLDKKILKQEISRTVIELGSKVMKDRGTTGSRRSSSGIASFSEVWGFIERFSLIDMTWSDEIEDIIRELSVKLVSDPERNGLLVDGFLARERLSPLFFEEYGVRLLHCKSHAVEVPLAGILEFPGTQRTRMIYLIAPDPCPDHQRLMLSEITNSFLSEEEFQKTMLQGDLRAIRKVLMDTFRDFF